MTDLLEYPQYFHKIFSHIAFRICSHSSHIKYGPNKGVFYVTHCCLCLAYAQKVHIDDMLEIPLFMSACTAPQQY